MPSKTPRRSLLFPPSSPVQTTSPLMAYCAAAAALSSLSCCPNDATHLSPYRHEEEEEEDHSTRADHERHERALWVINCRITLRLVIRPPRVLSLPIYFRRNLYSFLHPFLPFSCNVSFVTLQFPFQQRRSGGKIGQYFFSRSIVPSHPITNISPLKCYELKKPDMNKGKVTASIT